MLTSEAIARFLTAKTALGLSKETLRWYSGILQSFVNRFPELPDNPETIYSFLSECKGGDERRHGYYRALRAFYRYLELRLRVFSSPMKFVEAPRRRIKYPRPLTLEELQILINYPHPAPIRASIMFLVDSGCRIGELYNLSLDDLFETQYGFVAQVNGKTGQRLVPISYDAYHEMMVNLPLPYTLYRLRRLISKAFRDAGVPGSAHTLRHTFGTLWEGDELVLQKIMGHANLSTTLIYRRLRTRVMQEQHHMYSPLHKVFTRTENML